MERGSFKRGWFIFLITLCFQCTLAGNNNKLLFTFLISICIELDFFTGGEESRVPKQKVKRRACVTS